MSRALTVTSPRAARLVGVAMAATLLLSVLVGGITASPAHADGAIAPTSFWLAQPDGAVLPVGNAPNLGSTPPLNQPVVGTASTPDDGGYWLVASDGGIFTFGDAGFFGSEGGQPLNQPIVGMASTPDSNGYWLVASDGGVFTFGDAGFYGSEGGQHLNQPVVGIAPTPDGRGYWLIASDGGVFTFGDAGFFGSMGGSPLNKPMVGLTATPDGGGYWMFAGDGGVFTFGDAGFYGSTGNISTEPAQRVVSTSSGQGYWVVDQNGTSYGFGDAGSGREDGSVRGPFSLYSKSEARSLESLQGGPVGLECLAQQAFGVFQLNPQFVGGAGQVFPALDRGLGIGRIGEMGGIVDPGALLLGLDFALQIDRHPLEVGDHTFNLGDPSALLVDLKLLQAD